MFDPVSPDEALLVAGAVGFFVGLALAFLVIYWQVQKLRRRTLPLPAPRDVEMVGVLHPLAVIRSIHKHG